MGPLGSNENPLKVAVIGAGPSGFYAAETLLTGNIAVKVDMFDRLPVPFGLVRYGVAPDHPKIKSVTKVFEKTASDARFSFLGGVHVGKDISLEEMRVFYDAVIFTCGAQTDRHLGIPGEDLAGSHTATEFVAWYNGHPDYRERKFDLSGEVAVVVGQGNVSMDVSRILSKTADELKNTDIAEHALEAISQSKIKEVHLIGRRGPVQAAFTPPEIKEFGELPGCDSVINNPADFQLNEASQKELEDPNRPNAKRNWDILQEFAKHSPSGKKKKFIVHFLQSPVELIGKNGRLQKAVFEKNILTGEAGSQKAQGAKQFEELACGIFFRSVGYRGVAIAGVPFDDKKGIFPNKEGRILNGEQVVSGLYASGWIKRGPSGVIGTNKPDSVASVQSLLADIPHLKPAANKGPHAASEFLRKKGVRFVSFEDWKKIDAAEIERGKPKGKPREKFIKIEDMFAVVGK